MLAFSGGIHNTSWIALIGYTAGVFIFVLLLNYWMNRD